MADPAVAEALFQQYPWVRALFGIPEIQALILEAVDPNVGFDPNAFQAKLFNTTWWRETPEPQRQAFIQQATDPSTYWSDIYAYTAEISAISDQLGRRLTPDEALWLAAVGKNRGISPDSAMMRHWLASALRPEEVMQGQGAAGAAKSQVEAIGHQWFRDVGLDVDYNWLARSGIDVVSGQDSLESINARYQSQAWHMYPHLREQIESGQTLADIFNPYRQIIAEELEMGSLDEVDMGGNSEWRGLLWWGHPSEGKARMPTESEIRTWARDRPQWWQTSAGKQTDAASTRSLLQMFGKVK